MFAPVPLDGTHVLERDVRVVANAIEVFVRASDGVALDDERVGAGLALNRLFDRGVEALN